MPMSDAQRLGEMTASRVAAVIFIDCFCTDAPWLADSPAFWHAATPFIRDRTAKGNLLERLQARLPAAQLAPYVAPFAERIETVDRLAHSLTAAHRKIEQGRYDIAPRSLAATLCAEQAALCAMFDLMELSRVWRRLVAIYLVFVDAVPWRNSDGASYVAKLLERWRDAGVVPARAGPAAGTMALLERRDVAATLAAFSRALDLARTDDGRLAESAADPRARLQELAGVYEAFGYMSQAMEAEKQAFLGERRRLISQTKDADRARGVALAAESLARTRVMVGWLHRTRSFYDRPLVGAPPETTLDLNIIQDYLRRTAATTLHRAGLMAMDLNEGLNARESREYSLSVAMRMIDLYATHFEPGQNPAIKRTTFHLLLGIMWYRLGKRAVSHGHMALAARLAAAVPAPELRLRLQSELAFARGIELEDVLGGTALLLDARARDPRYDEGMYLVGILLHATLAAQAHNPELATNILDSIAGLTLNKFFYWTMMALRVFIHIFQGFYHEAYLLALECAAWMSDEKLDGYWAVFFVLSGTRGLVHSRDPHNAVIARGWITEILRVSKQYGFSLFVMDAMVQEARICYNEHDYDACYALCRAVELYVPSMPRPWLACEWQILHAASKQHVTGEVVHVDAAAFENVLYTEFSDISMFPHLAAVCLRKLDTNNSDPPTPNLLADTVSRAMTGQIRPEDVKEQLVSSYRTQVEMQQACAVPPGNNPHRDEAPLAAPPYIDQHAYLRPHTDSEVSDDSFEEAWASDLEIDYNEPESEGSSLWGDESVDGPIDEPTSVPISVPIDGPIDVDMSIDGSIDGSIGSIRSIRSINESNDESTDGSIESDESVEGSMYDYMDEADEPSDGFTDEPLTGFMSRRFDSSLDVPFDSPVGRATPPLGSFGSPKGSSKGSSTGSFINQGRAGINQGRAGPRLSWSAERLAPIISAAPRGPASPSGPFSAHSGQIIGRPMRQPLFKDVLPLLNIQQALQSQPTELDALSGDDSEGSWLPALDSDARAAASAAASPDESTVTKRLRPRTGSPRIGRKRRSWGREPPRRDQP